MGSAKSVGAGHRVINLFTYLVSDSEHDDLYRFFNARENRTLVQSDRRRHSRRGWKASVSLHGLIARGLAERR